MVRVVSGDLFLSGAQALINAVNCEGAMGKGIALEFARRYPEMYVSYCEACLAGELRPGRLHVFERGIEFPQVLINFPTKDRWRNQSRIGYIRDGLKALVAECQARELQSLALPALGCGLGGLGFGQVSELVRLAFIEDPEIDVAIYQPLRSGGDEGSGDPVGAQVVPPAHIRMPRSRTGEDPEPGAPRSARQAGNGPARSS